MESRNRSFLNLSQIARNFNRVSTTWLLFWIGYWIPYRNCLVSDISVSLPYNYLRPFACQLLRFISIFVIFPLLLNAKKGLYFLKLLLPLVMIKWSLRVQIFRLLLGQLSDLFLSKPKCPIAILFSFGNFNIFGK